MTSWDGMELITTKIQWLILFKMAEDLLKNIIFQVMS